MRDLPFTRAEADARAAKALAHANDARARELYRYFQPDKPAGLPFSISTTSNQVTPGVVQESQSANITLTALAQLAALKLDAKRAIISVIDRKVQYVLAEATPSLCLSKGTTNDADDAKWKACSQELVGGKLCEKTIVLPPSKEGKNSFFVINDLAEDETFKTLQSVTGSPHIRFYAGTPLTTTKGINIGSFHIIDTEPREGLTECQGETLATLASVIMDYLDISRQASDGRRAARLSSGLSSFVEGSSSFVEKRTPKLCATLSEPERIPSPRRSPGPRSHGSRGSKNGQERNPLRPQNGDSKRSHSGDSKRSQQGESSRSQLIETKTNSVSLDRTDTFSSLDFNVPPEWISRNEQSDNDPERRTDDEMYGRLWTFKRAANLLRESLELGGDGGVMFLDAKSSPAAASEDRVRKDYFAKQGEPASVLAVSTNDEPFTPGSGTKEVAPAVQLEYRFLRQLLRRFPNGKLWHFHQDGTHFTSDDSDEPGDEATDKEDSPMSLNESTGRPELQRIKSITRRTDASLLRKYFPTANQVIFAPLWDAANSQWFSGCFCWSSVETRVFSPTVELGSVLGFGSSIMMEHSRMVSSSADRRKGDFIGNISHELRSPLHGILAATEFLTDAATTDIQRSLLETVRACGRTLLDTFDQILDFSKINSFERTRRSARKLRTPSEDGDRQYAQRKPQSLNISRIADIATITEEVVESVYIGHAYGTGNTFEDRTTWNPGSVNQHLSDRQLKFGQAVRERQLEVVLDIVPEDWVFMTEPGALRRVIMNLTGNALKYTERGHIIVKLESEDLHEPKSKKQLHGKMVILTVSDTGKGMTEEYLRSRLYMPFSQEDILAPGTGLGLSIVRSIVKMLSGSIDIQSRVGEGTSVRISIPLLRPTAGETPTTPSPPTVHQSDSERIELLRQSTQGRKIAVFGASDKTETAGCIPNMMAKYITEWFGCQIVPWLEGCDADLLIADENDLVELSKEGSTDLPPMLVLCRNGLRRARELCQLSAVGNKLDFLTLPCGPHKLARGISSCLLGPQSVSAGSSIQSQRYLSSTEHTSPNGSLGSGDVSPEFEALDLNDVSNKDPDNTDTAKTKQEIFVRRGANVKLRLPVSPVDVKPELLVQPSTPAKSPTTDGDEQLELPNVHQVLGQSTDETPSKSFPARVLIVEDNQINLQLLRTFMMKRKPDILDSASNGKQAVEATEKMSEGYNIIFMDISMPIMNGFEATRAIRMLEKERENSEPAIIIALTGLASDSDIAEAFTSGMDLFLTKPFSFKDVSRLLDDLQAKKNRSLTSEGADSSQDT